MGDVSTLFSLNDLPGHISFLLIGISYLLTSMFWLRVTAVVGLLLEIVYYRLSGGDMITGIAWDVVFVLINFVQIYRLVAERRALKSMKDVHLLRQGAFSALDDRELARLVKAGNWRTFDEGAKITSEGEPVSELVLICDGEASVNVHDQLITHLTRGALVGEMAFVSGRPASATVVVSNPTQAFAFDIAKLRGLVSADELIASALHRVIGHDLTQKLVRQT